MDVVRAPQGLDAPDKVALGLDATHLFYLVVFSMSGWALLTSLLPGFLRIPGGLSILACGAALAFGHYRQRPLDQWIALYLQFRLRELSQAATGSRHDDASGAPGAAPYSVPVATSAQRARRVAFYSDGGGVGKTTLALETAALAARRCTGGVAVIDADPFSSSMRVRAGIDGPTLPIGGAPGIAELEASMYRHPAGMHVCCMPDDRRGTSTTATPILGALLEHLDAQGYELVVVDLGTSLATREWAWSQDLMLAMDTVYCVFNPTAPGVFGVYRAVAALRRMGVRRLRLVSNRHDYPVYLGEVTADLRVGEVLEVRSLPGYDAAEDRHDCAGLADPAAASALMPLLEDLAPTYQRHQLAHAGGVLAGR